MGSPLLLWPDKLASETLPCCTLKSEATCWNGLRCNVLASGKHVVQNLTILTTGSAHDAALLAKKLRARQAFTAHMLLLVFQKACSTS